ncbi:MAG: hypothetical protein ABSA80_16405 [Terriglobales bacterium]
MPIPEALWTAAAEVARERGVFHTAKASGDTISCSNTYTPSGNDVPGSYTMSASFSGDTNYSASSSAQTNNFTINSASSTTSVSSSMNPSNYGQSVTFTATINGENGNVKGRTTRKGVKSQVVTGTVTWSANTGCGTTPVAPGYPGVDVYHLQPPGGDRYDYGAVLG